MPKLQWFAVEHNDWQEPPQARLVTWWAALSPYNAETKAVALVEAMRNRTPFDGQLPITTSSVLQPFEEGRFDAYGLDELPPHIASIKPPHLQSGQPAGARVLSWQQEERRKDGVWLGSVRVGVEGEFADPNAESLGWLTEQDAREIAAERGFGFRLV